MKRILCVAALAGLTTALHAVTYAWNDKTNAFETQKGETIPSYDEIAEAHPKMTALQFSFWYTVASTDVTKPTYAIQQNVADGAKTDLIRLNVENNGSTGGNRASYTVNGQTLKGSDGWTEARAGNDKWVQTTFAFSDIENGVFKSLKVTHAFLSPYPPESLEDNFTGSFDFSGKTFDYFDYASLTVTVPMTVEIVPEPGVMALLALGVAGLALRRKVA